VAQSRPRGSVWARGLPTVTSAARMALPSDVGHRGRCGFRVADRLASDGRDLPLGRVVVALDLGGNNLWKHYEPRWIALAATVSPG